MIFTFLYFIIISSSLSDISESYFEGNIQFEHSYKSNSIDIDSLKIIRSNSAFYLFKGPYYKGVTYSKDTLIYIYNGNLSKCLFSKTSDNSVYCFDYSQSNDSKLKSWKILKATKEILGYKCNILVFEYPSYTSKYYYSKEIKLDPKVYETHAAYDYKKRLELTEGSVALLSEIIYPEYTMSISATKIISMEVSDNEFYLDSFEVCD